MFDDGFPNAADGSVEWFQRVGRVVGSKEPPIPMLNERAVLEAMAKRKQRSILHFF